MATVDSAVVENEGITKSLLETEDWLYEDSDEQKLKDLKKLINTCMEVEQYLSGQSPKNFDQISWSNLIKKTMRIFNRMRVGVDQYLALANKSLKVAKQIAMKNLIGWRGEKELSEIGFTRQMVLVGHQASGALELWNYPLWLRDIVPQNVDISDRPDHVDLPSHERCINHAKSAASDVDASQKMKKIEDMVNEIEQSCLDIIGHDYQDEDEIPNPLSQRNKRNVSSSTDNPFDTSRKKPLPKSNHLHIMGRYLLLVLFTLPSTCAVVAPVLAPELFTTTPTLAIPKAISRAGLDDSQIDFYEINKAFAVALAHMGDQLPGLTKMWTHLECQSGGQVTGCINHAKSAASDVDASQVIFLKLSELVKST
ncbi:hypothetical protein CTI12_AA179840 [Artemisia annua]|uniref:Thiolase C-terminal domain-containing protein n=1 Tax=Artemisia annua TaxID=35608 RepID=A0A2U1P8L3_ARTAN|nr:hypothetical protein CTI12_AA179840 [Artemisia annua]